MKARNAALLVAVSLAVNGCAVPGNRGSDDQPTPSGGSDVSQVCNPFIVGAGAALVCAALAKGNKRVLTGAACAAVAVTGCYLLNSYKAEQTRTAKQVEEEYLQRNRQLPERTVVTAYQSEVNPRGAVSKGQKVNLTSTIVAVQGRSDRGVLVEEEVGIVDSHGEAWAKPVRKTANSSNQAGEFRTSFTVPISDGWSQGVYTVRRTLYVNGVVAQRDDANTRFQVVHGPERQPLIAEASQ